MSKFAPLISESSSFFNFDLNLLILLKLSMICAIAFRTNSEWSSFFSFVYNVCRNLKKKGSLSVNIVLSISSKIFE